MPEVGSTFESFATKKEAEEYVRYVKEEKTTTAKPADAETPLGKRIPLIIKTDVMGTIEALEKEIEKLNTSELSFKIVGRGVGAINESDLKMANVDKESIIVGFNTKIDAGARDLNESLKVDVQLFSIIYKLTDYLKEIVEARRPRQEVAEVIGTLKILKTFGATKDKQVVGGKVASGRITVGATVRIIRRDFQIGTGKVVEIQMNKIKTKEVLEDTECGMLIEAKVGISAGDILEAFIVNIK
jgi:translation initiation factor IF-2